MILLELFGILISIFILCFFVFSYWRYKTVGVKWRERRWGEICGVFAMLSYMVGLIWLLFILVPFLQSIDWSFWYDFWSFEVW